MGKIMMKGNEAIGEAAIMAGCTHYFGYPITPQSELTAYMARMLPKRGGVFLQSESEVAAINMLYGAGAAGARVMTSSSGPGISLMSEGISYIACSEIPVVLVNIQRGGPGLGTIQPSQADYLQATKGGGHGDYHLIVLAPSSVQELVNLTQKAFDLADKYRNPVMVLGDGLLGQMMEPVEIKKIEPKNYDKSWALTGAKERAPHRITSFDIDPHKLEEVVRHLKEKYIQIKRDEVMYEEMNTEDAEILIVAFGSMGRISKTVIRELEEEGIKAGLLRPITLWPFPEKKMYELGARIGKVFVTEMNAGQMVEDVERVTKGKAEIYFYGRPGGVVPTPKEIKEEIKEVLGR